MHILRSPVQYAHETERNDDMFKEYTNKFQF